MLFTGYGLLGKAEAQEKGYGAFKRFWHNFGYVVTFRWLKKKEK